MGGMEAPEPIVVARIPSVVTSMVPVCVVSKGVYTSVTKCVLQRAHSVGARVCVRVAACVKETPRVKEAPCVSGVVASVPKCVLPSTPCVEEAPRVNETPCVEGMTCVSETHCASGRPCVSGTTCAREMVRVSEARCVRGTECVRSLYVREMTVGMREHATACPRVSVMEWCVSVVTRRCAWVEWRRRRRQTRDKGRVAAVVVLGTAPSLHGSKREVRACCARGRHVLGCASETRCGNAHGRCCRSRDGQKLGWGNGFGTDGFSRRACV